MYNLAKIKQFQALLLPSVLLLLSSCSSQTQRLTPTEELFVRERVQVSENSSEALELPARAADEIAPGYKIALHSELDSALRGSYLVDFDGLLKLPYGVRVNTTGKNISELQASVISAYQPFFKVPPDVSVRISAKKYLVEVAGLVVKPGKYSVSNDDNVDVLIAKAGGLQTGADQKPVANYLKIEQLNSQRLIKLSDHYAGVEGLIPSWQGGDSVFFQRERGGLALFTGDKRDYVHVIGEIREPGEYVFRENADFYHYLVEAGGPTGQADLNQIAIVRAVENHREKIIIEEQAEKAVPTIESGDIIIVYGNSPSAFEKDVKVSSQVAGIFSTFATVAVLAIAL